MRTEENASFERRLAAVERELAEIKAAADTKSVPEAGAGATADADPLWFVNELGRRTPGAVMMAGDVEIPGSGPVRWQYALMAQDIIERDWTDFTATIDALGHPARLTIVRLVLKGVKSTAELLEQDTLGTTGQIHHHLRQLIAAGWLVSARRGHYEVPVHRVVPLLVLMMTTVR